MFPQTLLAKVGAAILLLGLVFSSGYITGRNAIKKSDAVAVVKDTVQNVKEITHAEDVKSETVRTVIKYVHDKPLGPVSLCVAPSSEPTSTPGTEPSTPGGLAAEVHDGDSGVRPKEAGPDISGLLSAYATVFALKNADLAEQQAVK
jgi:hypothetical protein